MPPAKTWCVKWHHLTASFSARLLIVEGSQEDSPLRSVILRLGGFHILMSFLGSIGHLMAGTGLQELLEVIFAGNTVSHILSGKAVARAIRALAARFRPPYTFAVQCV